MKLEALSRTKLRGKNMVQVAEVKTLSVKDFKVQDLVMTGEAADMMGTGIDRRTFKAWAKKFGVSPIGLVNGNKEVYLRKDVERVIEKYNAAKGGRK